MVRVVMLSLVTEPLVHEEERLLFAAKIQHKSQMSIDEAKNLLEN